MQEAALKYETEVKPGGRVELEVPLEAGVAVTVLVIESTNGHFMDLLSASHTSLEFWDNPLDDEDWNNA